MSSLRAAPDWDVETWLNTDGPVDLAGLRGRVVVVLAFQMLCAGCVEIALPQLRRVQETFDPAKVAALALHTVFEHHEAMTAAALQSFLRERRFDFPVGIDRPGAEGGLPRTMARYNMQGTPTLILIDRQGRLRQQTFGHFPDLALGAAIATLAMQPAG